MEQREVAALRVLELDYNTTSEEMRTQITSLDRILSIGLTVLGGIATIGFIKKIDWALVFLPMGLGGILLYGLFVQTTILTLGGYRKHLAQQFTLFAPGVTVCWEDLAAECIQRNIALRCLTAIYGLAYALSWTSSLYIAHRDYVASKSWSAVVFWLDLLAFVLLTAGLVASVVTASHAFQRAYIFVRSKTPSRAD